MSKINLNKTCAFPPPVTVVLVGLMGVGKTSIGKRLAERLNMPFVDADEEIEKASGLSIPDFFEKFGEKEFRKGEQRVIARLLRRQPCVVATGGGAFMALETRGLIKKCAVSLWLNADLDTLDTRLQRRSGRPLLQTDNPRNTIKSLMDQRYPIYAEADLMIETSNVSFERALDSACTAITKYFSSNYE